MYTIAQDPKATLHRNGVQAVGHAAAKQSTSAMSNRHFFCTDNRDGEAQLVLIEKYDGREMNERVLGIPASYELPRNGRAREQLTVADPLQPDAGRSRTHPALQVDARRPYCGDRTKELPNPESMHRSLTPQQQREYLQYLPVSFAEGLCWNMRKVVRWAILIQLIVAPRLGPGLSTNVPCQPEKLENSQMKTWGSVLLLSTHRCRENILTDIGINAPALDAYKSCSPFIRRQR